MDLDQALTAGIELALNRYLSLDSEALARFSSLEGKVIAIDIKGIHKTVSLFPSSDGFMVLANFDGDAQLWMGIACAVVGLAAIIILERFAPKKS